MVLMPHKSASIKTIHIGQKNIIVSSDGLCRYKTKWRKPKSVDNKGYITTSFPFDRKGVENKKCCTYTMHWLMATAFCNNPFKESKHQQVFVQHKDGDKTNNNPYNLEWVNKSKTVYRYDTSGIYTKMKFHSVTEASLYQIGNKSGIPSISSCCNEKKYKWQGFEWSFHPPEMYKNKRSAIKINISKYFRIRNSTRTDYKGRTRFRERTVDSRLPELKEESKKEVDDLPELKEEESVDKLPESIPENDDVFIFNNTCDEDLFSFLGESIFEF